MKRQPYFSIAIIIVFAVTFFLLAMEGLRHAGAQDVASTYVLPALVQQRVNAKFMQLTGQPAPLPMRSVTTNARACLAAGQFGAVAPVNGYFVSVKLNGVEFRYYSTPAGAVALCNIKVPRVTE